MLPKSIQKFIEIFASLPSIGPRQATRLAFHIRSLGDDQIEKFTRVIADLKNIKICSQCFFTYAINDSEHANSKNICEICSNPRRHKDIIAVVEKETDLISLEKVGGFGGRYLVLGDLKKSGTLETTHKLRLNNLKNFIREELGGQATEIVLAINPTTYGDLNASIIGQELKGNAKKITRLGRGIPTGGEIEFADEDTLSNALENRN